VCVIENGPVYLQNRVRVSLAESDSNPF